MAEAAAPVEEAHNDSSKLRTFLTILRKFIGVADLASVRFSLPSQLLEPTPNLEYWNYLDAPNTFIAIGTSDEPVDRMLEVLRFWFTKDLKYARGRPCKPYNSCLGEFFRCNWDAEDNAPAILHQELATGGGSIRTNGNGGGNSSASSVRSTGSNTGSNGGGSASTPREASNVSVLQTGTNPANGTVRVSYLTEQTSHHPPVSAFFISCPERGLHARGFDQITAKFTGTSIKVSPGEHNLGIFVTLEKRDNETYQLQHPPAHLGGLLRGALSVSVGDVAYITCPKTKLKAILQYYDEGWLGRTTNKVDGIIFRYDPDNDDKLRIRDVPEEDILVRLNGPWKEKILFTIGPKPVASHPVAEQTTIIDLIPLSVAPKILPPDEKQLPNESLQLWGGVTKAIRSKQFSLATTLKQELEEGQREKAREREHKKEDWKPVFFEQPTGNGGKPELSAKGWKVLERAQKGDWSMDGILEEAATPSEV
ncbi:oxysterol-binding protein [Grosmannia clavigera kw1407]|uniref:Oxysterol-binding protein n=1 Tax=Grosmannia clavigera (strain kw1407 / UAMH 11150) TaxID=655863 RepID=F0XEI4_GROCL|nr:oxysterol-binding protein [Grosmannia clavigera kw1407]EFX03878.1 oxysterol-binding protein [Grosmannia clavigera kw1407]